MQIRYIIWNLRRIWLRLTYFILHLFPYCCFPTCPHGRSCCLTIVLLAPSVRKGVCELAIACWQAFCILPIACCWLPIAYWSSALYTHVFRAFSSQLACFSIDALRPPIASSLMSQLASKWYLYRLVTETCRSCASTLICSNPKLQVTCIHSHGEHHAPCTMHLPWDFGWTTSTSFVRTLVCSNPFI